MSELRTAAQQALEILESGVLLCELTAASVLRQALLVPDVDTPTYVLVRDYDDEYYNVRTLVGQQGHGAMCHSFDNPKNPLVSWDQCRDISDFTIDFPFVDESDVSVLDYTCVARNTSPMKYAEAKAWAATHNARLPTREVAQRMYEIGALRGTTWCAETQGVYTAFVVGEDGQCCLHGLTNKAFAVCIR